MNKNFDNFELFLHDLNFNFKIICFTETWCRKADLQNSNFEIPGYTVIHQPRADKSQKGGGVR